MTRKDFELIARTIAALHDEMSALEYEPVGTGTVRLAALKLAEALATTNPRFDRARFLSACGV